MTVASGLEVWLLVPSTILPAVAALLIGVLKILGVNPLSA